MIRNMEKIDTAWARETVYERFLRYAAVETTSDRHAKEQPSTSGQWDLLNMLRDELTALGISDVTLDENGYLIARLPALGAENAPTVGFMAHVDTASEASGRDVKPLLHENYDGSPIELKNGIVLDSKEFPELLEFTGKTLITSDGTTLLGADDKAGVAEIMTALEWLCGHPEMPRGAIEVLFTPDEETGWGMDRFSADRLKSVYCYTLDGDGDGTIEAECFFGYQANITCRGVSIHPGHGRGKLRNAVTMAAEFISGLPRNESPEAADGRFGFYMPLGIRGSAADAEVQVLIRDFEYEEIERRIRVLKAIAGAVEGQFPGGKVEIEIVKQYENLRSYLDKESRGLDILRKAVGEAGSEVKEKSIRGGTDGARLAEKGIPTPNVFTGGGNYHGVREYAVLEVMVKAVRTVVNCISLWAEET
jgi:tripeptide aminopeptidase